MDAMPWIDEVKRSKKLTVYMGNLGAPWETSAAEAYKEFNKLATNYSLGVKLEKISESTMNKHGANVEFRIANGAVEFEYGDKTYSGTFDGKAKHGLTLLAARDKKIEKARIHLPESPMIHTPTETRAVGPKVRLLIVLHEFLHACGLTNSQHTPEGVFQATPAVFPGDTAAGDKVQRTRGSENIRYMPPYVIADDIKTIIVDLWK